MKISHVSLPPFFCNWATDHSKQSVHSGTQSLVNVSSNEICVLRFDVRRSFPKTPFHMWTYFNQTWKVAPALTCTVNTRVSRFFWLNVQKVYIKKLITRSMCLFVLRFEESAVQTGGRWPTQRQVEAGTTAARVLGHLALKETPQTRVDALKKTISHRTRLPPSCMLRTTEVKLHDPERRSLNLRHKLN